MHHLHPLKPFKETRGHWGKKCYLNLTFLETCLPSLVASISPPAQTELLMVFHNRIQQILIRRL